MFFLNRKLLAVGIAFSITAPTYAFGQSEMTQHHAQARSKAANDLMLSEQEELAASAHAIRREVENLTKEFEQKKCLLSKNDSEAWKAKAREALAWVEFELNIVFERISTLNKRRWKTETHLYQKGLYGSEDIKAFDHIISNFRNDYVSVLGRWPGHVPSSQPLVIPKKSSKEKLAEALNNAENHDLMLDCLVTKIFPSKQSDEMSPTDRLDRETSFYQLSVEPIIQSQDRDTRISNLAERNNNTCKPGAVCFENYAEAITYGAGSDFGDGDGTPPLHKDNKEASPSVSISAGDISPGTSKTPACDPYAGPYCGKSISEIIEMKRLEDDF